VCLPQVDLPAAIARELPGGLRQAASTPRDALRSQPLPLQPLQVRPRPPTPASCSPSRLSAVRLRAGRFAGTGRRWWSTLTCWRRTTRCSPRTASSSCRGCRPSAPTCPTCHCQTCSAGSTPSVRLPAALSMPFRLPPTASRMMLMGAGHAMQGRASISCWTRCRRRCSCSCRMCCSTSTRSGRTSSC